MLRVKLIAEGKVRADLTEDDIMRIAWLIGARGTNADDALLARLQLFLALMEGKLPGYVEVS